MTVRRRFVMLGLLVLLSETAFAQPYPAKPIRVVVTQTPGSSMDVLTRMVTPKMSEMFGQQFVIDNRGGAAGVIGAQIGARAVPDGYTLIFGGASSLMSASPEEFGTFFRADFDRVAKLIKIAGIKPE
jgi:tripartite-type tricarboxylate transporter receptor subunit TctC